MVRALMAVGKEPVPKLIRPGKLEELGSLLDLTVRNGVSMDEEAYSDALQEAGAEIVITGWDSPMLTVRTLEANPQLRYMCHLTGTVRGHVGRQALEKGLLVSNWGSLIGPEVAEGALFGILSCLKRSTQRAFLMHRDQGWLQGDSDGGSLFRQRVGLHGFGAIAQALVGLLRPFECEVSTYSPHAPDEVLGQHQVKRVTELRELYAGNRIISVHASDTPANRHIVGSEILGAMQDGAVLVNTARGAVVDTAALVEELQSGRIHASLDVFETEPLPADSRLRGLLNCQLTCHEAGAGGDLTKFGDHAVENIRRYLWGEPVDSVVDLPRYDLMT